MKKFQITNMLKVWIILTKLEIKMANKIKNLYKGLNKIMVKIKIVSYLNYCFYYSLAIVAVIIIGVLSLIIKSNFNGIADKNRNEIKIPILRELAKAPEDYDPYDPKI